MADFEAKFCIYAFLLGMMLILTGIILAACAQWSRNQDTKEKKSSTQS